MSRFRSTLLASRFGIKPADLFLQQLPSVTRLFQERGKTVMALADIVAKYPQIATALPQGLIAIPWHFTSEDPEYKSRLGLLVERHVPHIVQPGAMYGGSGCARLLKRHSRTSIRS